MTRHNPERVRIWRGLIDAWKRSGLSVNAFCRRRKLTRSNFDRWRRILPAEPAEPNPSSSPAFVPLRVAAEPTAEVVLPSGVVVRLPLSATSETVIRPLAVGRANWLQIGGDSGLKTASVLMSVCASATRHRLNPWSYLRDVLDQLAARSAGGEGRDLLPDAWTGRQATSRRP